MSILVVIRTRNLNIINIYQDASEDWTKQGIPEVILQSGSNEQVNVVHMLVN